MDINSKIIIPIVLIIFAINSCKAQEKRLLKNTKKNIVPTYNDLKLSAKGRWLLSRTLYSQNADTTLVFDTKKNRLQNKIVKLNVKQNFLGEKAIIAQGVNHVEYIGLSNFESEIYKDVYKCDILSELEEYIILTHQHYLTIYDSNTRIKNKSQEIEDYVTDNKTKLVAITKKDSLYGIVNVLGNRKEVILGKNKISIIPQFIIEKYAAFIETEEETGKIRCILFNIETSQIQIPFLDFIDADFIKLTSILGGKGFLIESEKRNTPENNNIDIRYGNDEYMRFRKRGQSINKYWFFSTLNGSIQNLFSEKSFDFISLNRERYFLAFNKKEQNDYRFSQPLFDLNLFDIKTGNLVKIGSYIRNLEVSRRGRYVVMYNEVVKEWFLYDIDLHEELKLGGAMSNPLFTYDESQVLFESEHGIKVFNLDKRIFCNTLLPKFQTFLSRDSSVNIFQKYELIARSTGEDLKRGIIIKAYDKTKNEQSYFKWDGNELKLLLPASKMYIKDFVIGIPNKTIYTIEESFNQKPNIYKNRIGTSKNCCLSCTRERELLPQLERAIIHYKNDLGIPLQGILYYPQDFEPSKKYPMVVKIYMEQSYMSNRYVLNEEGGDGFNIRKLVENGYFVYLPDIVMDERGSGLSALDCVHHSLDVLVSIPSIDLNRVGLTGHSFGGFETNFIATHSNRFKAYLSGSGVSNLTGHYFTHNPHMGYNEYSRVENGQYGMKVPFSKDKILYWNNNPIYFADQVNAPILLWAGLKDNNVLPSESMGFYTALVRNKKDVIGIFYSNQGHIFDVDGFEIEDFSKRSLDWWNYFLKEKKDIKWINKQMEKDAF